MERLAGATKPPGTRLETKCLSKNKLPGKLLGRLKGETGSTKRAESPTKCLNKNKLRGRLFVELINGASKPTGPVEAATRPVIAATGPVEAATGPVEAATGPVEAVTGPVAATGPVEAATEADSTPRLEGTGTGSSGTKCLNKNKNKLLGG